MNTAGRVGQKARLNCTAFLPIYDYVEWSSFVDDGTGERIFLSADPEEVLVEGYSVEVGGNGKFDLILDSVHPSQAGRYECRLLLGGEKASVEFVSLCEYIVHLGITVCLVSLIEGKMMNDMPVRFYISFDIPRLRVL